MAPVKILAAIGFLAMSVQAHIQMSSPAPICSPENTVGKCASVDYSYTTPLSAGQAGGKNAYPCKGYADEEFAAVANYQAGSTQKVTLKGSAVHGGGSCQLAFSYDKGQTWKVVKSMIGGCPITQEYDFTVPSDAPSGNALLAWTWFNRIGNREMYMNCAQVTVSGGSGSAKRASAGFSSLPDLFIANVGQEGGCVTVENEDVDFPNPGSDVLRGQDTSGNNRVSYVSGGQAGTGYKCSGSSPGTSGSSSSSSSSGSSNSGSSSNASGGSSSTTAATSSSKVPNSFTTKASTTAASTASAPASSAAATSEADPAASGSCVPGALKCEDGAAKFAICDGEGERWIDMGALAAGTMCSQNRIVDARYSRPARRFVG